MLRYSTNEVSHGGCDLAKEKTEPAESTDVQQIGGKTDAQREKEYMSGLSKY